MTTNILNFGTAAMFSYFYKASEHLVMDRQTTYPLCHIKWLAAKTL